MVYVILAIVAVVLVVLVFLLWRSVTSLGFEHDELMTKVVMLEDRLHAEEAVSLDHGLRLDEMDEGVKSALTKIGNVQAAHVELSKRFKTGAESEGG